MAAVALAAALVAGCSSGSASHTSGSTSTAPPAARLAPTKVVPHTALTGAVAFMGPVRTVAVGRYSMAFRQFGSGPDLLMIAGQASSMSVWPYSTLAALAAHHRVTIYDNRDLGNTTGPDRPFTLPDLADDAATLITALGLHHPAVFGWSTGGEIGLLLAIRHPGVVSALAITGATPGGPNTVQPAPAVNALFAESDPSVPKMFDVLFVSAKAKSRYLAEIIKLPQLAGAADATARYNVAEQAYFDAPEPDLGSIKIPVLVMNGAADYAVPPANARYIAKRLGSNAKLALDPGGRHAWFFEHAAHFQALMTAFLR